MGSIDALLNKISIINYVSLEIIYEINELKDRQSNIIVFPAKDITVETPTE